MSNSIVDVSEAISVLKAKNAKSTIIAFGGLAQQPGMPIFEFAHTLSDMNTNCVFVRDVTRTWYQHPIPGLGASIEEKLASIRACVPDIDSQPFFTLGTSMGGFAAILFGSLLGASGAISLGGQAFIDARTRKLVGDDRWSERIEKIQSSAYTSLLNLRAVAQRSKVRIVQLAGSNERLDLMHALYLSDLKKVETWLVTDSDHNIAKSLKQAEMLKPFLGAVLANGALSKLKAAESSKVRLIRLGASGKPHTQNRQATAASTRGHPEPAPAGDA